MKWYLKALKNYAVFEGRARRSEYWYYILFYLLFAFVVAWISIYIKIPSLYLLYILGSVIPTIAVSVRRMHDVDKSGWFILIPIYNLVMYCTNGSQGPNRFGSDPKNPEFEEFLNESETGKTT
jgi:uncharacterized membrane protein YhaH (DUF805 family)